MFDLTRNKTVFNSKYLFKSKKKKDQYINKLTVKKQLANSKEI